MDNPTPQDESPLELSRLLANVLRVGTVAHVRAKPTPACRVQSGQLKTQWLPWISSRAGGKAARTWWAPQVGEQCVVLSPGGEMTQGLVLVGLFSDTHPAGSDNLKACRVDLSAKEFFEHDGNGNAQLTVERTLTLRVGATSIVMNGSTVEFTAGGGKAVLSAGGLKGTPDVYADNISGKTHQHDKVQAGKALSGKPQP